MTLSLLLSRQSIHLIHSFILWVLSSLMIRVRILDSRMQYYIPKITYTLIYYLPSNIAA
jgi:hypothetical protein